LRKVIDMYCDDPEIRDACPWPAELARVECGDLVECDLVGSRSRGRTMAFARRLLGNVAQLRVEGLDL
jgi:hypothetical protein